MTTEQAFELGYQLQISTIENKSFDGNESIINSFETIFKLDSKESQSYFMNAFKLGRYKAQFQRMPIESFNAIEITKVCIILGEVSLINDDYGKLSHFIETNFKSIYDKVQLYRTVKKIVEVHLVNTINRDVFSTKEGFIDGLLENINHLNKLVERNK
jgi:hypothetical protein